MIFVAAIETQPNTPQSDPVITPIDIIFGKITQVMVFFPPGVNALAHIKLLWGLRQIFPSNEEGDFAGGDVLIVWPEDIDVNTEPATITAYTWNDDDTYPHTITVHIVIVPAIASPDVASVIAAVNQGSG